MGASHSTTAQQHRQYRLPPFAFHDDNNNQSAFRQSFPQFNQQPGVGGAVRASHHHHHSELLFPPPYFGYLPPLAPMFPLHPNIGPGPLSPDMRRLPLATNIPMPTSSPSLQQKPKKNFFMPYMNPEAVERGLNSKHLIKVCGRMLWCSFRIHIVFKGHLHVNQRNFEEAYIDNPDGDDQLDIVLIGLHDRNRALHGDVVVVRIKERIRWIVSHR
jgi:hypothetical protein